MPYVVNNSRGQLIAVIQDGTINTTATSLTLIGKNYTPYGEIAVENMVYQLENFANTESPINPVTGQLWWDIGADELKVYDGTAWVNVSGITASASAPLSPKVSDIWFNTDTNIIKVYTEISTGIFDWVNINRVAPLSSAPSGAVQGDVYFDTTRDQLFIYDGSTWLLVGPESVPGFGATKWSSTTLRDTSATARAVMLGQIDGETVAIASNLAFTILANDRPTGFVDLVKGITLSASSSLSGLASSATRLQTPRLINGVAFDGTADVIVPTSGNLIPGTFISGNTYSGLGNVTWNVTSSSTNTAGTLVSRNSQGDFAAGNITATLIGTANNVRDIVATVHGGTGQSTYANGDILVGQSGSLVKGRIVAGTNLAVAVDAGNITVSYIGGTGVGNVTSVGITAGSGIAVSGSPITTSGNIEITNVGVLRVQGGSGLAVSQATGNVTLTNTGVTSLSAGTGLAATGSTGSVTLTNTGVTRLTAGGGVSLSGSTGDIVISASGIISGISGGSGISVGGSPSFPTITNTGVLSISGSSGISVSSGAGSVSIFNTGVTRLSPGPGIELSGSTGSITITSTAQGGTTFAIPELAGTIKLWAAATPPTGWQVCNGSAISRAAYPQLFQRIGTTYGSGDGSSTFNIPDMRNRFSLGVGPGNNLGQTGGNANIDVVLAHTHSIAGAVITGSTATAGQHTHLVSDPGHTHRQTQTKDGNAQSPVDQWAGIPGKLSTDVTTSSSQTGITLQTAGVHAHGFTAVLSGTTASTGGSGAGANIPPYLALNWIIKLSDTDVGSNFTAGMILAWSGSIASIPQGWILCNGQGGAPDLRNRFIIGAGGTYNPNDTGGSADAVLVAHSHSLAATTITGTTASAGVHRHNITNQDGTGPQWLAFSRPDLNPPAPIDNTGFPAGINGNDRIFEIADAGSHTHTFSAVLSGNTASAGGSGTNANLPPYYALAYIMYTGSSPVPPPGPTPPPTPPGPTPPPPPPPPPPGPRGSFSVTTPGTYQWTVPAGVTSISVVGIGGGAGGGSITAGGGGALNYVNRFAVSPGQTYTIVVGAGGPAQSNPFNTIPLLPTAGGDTAMYIADTSGVTYVIYATGASSLVGLGGQLRTGLSRSTGGNGGNGRRGGGGTGGYLGKGGDGGESNSPGQGAEASGGGGGGGGGGTIPGKNYGGGSGGGVGIIGMLAQNSGGAGGNTQVSNVGLGGRGCLGPFGSGENGSDGGQDVFLLQGGGTYGGGGAAASYDTQFFSNTVTTLYGGFAGGQGALRIIWPGTRSFPFDAR